MESLFSTFEMFHGIRSFRPIEVAVEGISVCHGHSRIGKSVFVQVLGQEGFLRIPLENEIAGIIVLR